MWRLWSAKERSVDTEREGCGSGCCGFRGFSGCGDGSGGSGGSGLGSGSYLLVVG